MSLLDRYIEAGNREPAPAFRSRRGRGPPGLAAEISTAPERLAKRFGMLLLALDTAGPDCAAALARSAPRGCEIVARRSECLGRGHAERLMPMIAELLAETATSFTHIRRIVVTTGPGSFTGIRVGVAAARGLALALAVPAVGVGSLEALAFNAAKGRETG